MIQIGETTIDLNDPMTLAMVIGGCLLVLLLVLMIFAIRGSVRAARSAEPMAEQMTALGEHLRGLSENQHALSGGLKAVSDAQAAAQAQMVNTLERRLAEVQVKMGETLHGTAQKTARSLGELHTRLETIDKAQTNIEKLSSDV